MKNRPLRLALLATLCTMLLVPTVTISPAQANEKDSKQQNAHSNKKVNEAKQNKASQKRKEIISEAVAAIRDTENALKAVVNKDTDKALKLLETVTGKLEIILARSPSLALAPVDINIVTYDILADVEAVKKLKEKAVKALEDGRVQEARLMIRNLASETVISIKNIPLATYPDAIKKAVKLIDENKLKEAGKVLQTALDTLVVTESVIPLPIVAAQSLLKEAEKLAQKKDRNDKDSKRLTDLLVGAHRELEFAEVLGYGTKDDFMKLYSELSKIEEKTSDKKSGTGFFDKIKGYLEDVLK